jgi:hypothetical protein
MSATVDQGDALLDLSDLPVRRPRTFWKDVHKLPRTQPRNRLPHCMQVTFGLIHGKRA